MMKETGLLSFPVILHLNFWFLNKKGEHSLIYVLYLLTFFYRNRIDAAK